ncbi:MAG TPA: HPP family protein [Thermodesulfobacteriaceae bacterium]|nr:HPP family protein [Thermodesulfobacteriaceae bacterium]
MSDFWWELSKLFRIRFFYLATKGHIKKLTALYVLITGFLSLAVLGAVSYFFSWPLVFPSLGPTAFLIFYAPAKAMSWPRNCVLGHLIAMVCGWLTYLLFLWLFPEKAIHTQFGAQFGLAKTLFVSGAMAITALLMVLFEVLHPPAASTAMLAAGGYFENYMDVLGFILALFLLLIEGIVLHRLAGIIYPLWKIKGQREEPAIRTKIGEVGKVSSDDPYATLAHHLVTKRE